MNPGLEDGRLAQLGLHEIAAVPQRRPQLRVPAGLVGQLDRAQERDDVGLQHDALLGAHAIAIGQLRCYGVSS